MSAPETPRRAANILVLVALAAMLVGAILLLSARDPTRADVPAGGTATVLDFETAEWDPLGRSYELRVFITQPGSANVSVVWTQGSDNETVVKTLTTESPRLVVWDDVEGRQRVTVEVQNDGPDAVRVAGETEGLLRYAAAGGFVLIGLFGFVFYRVGMS